MKSSIRSAGVIVIKTPVTIRVSEYSNSADRIRRKEQQYQNTQQQDYGCFLQIVRSASWEKPAGNYLRNILITNNINFAQNNNFAQKTDITYS
jgi:hypothetical protein